jgi:subtilisin-like proprotein convertase family protein
MDNVRIWNYAKSMFTEINRDMNIPLTMHLPTGLYTGLMASWLFNNTSDWSGAVDNNGYLRGGADYVDYSQKLSVYCSYNNSVILDGTTAYLAGGNSANYNATTGITIETWFKRDTSAGVQPATQNIVNKSGGTSRYNYGIYFNLANNNIVFAINDGTQSITSPTSSVTLSRWYHVAGTYEQSTGLMKLYLNGDSVAGAVISGNPAINNNPDSLCIGGIAATNYSANKFRGQIDGIRIWKDFVKTPAQVKGEMYKSRIQDAANLCSEITFDTYTNLVHAPNNGWGYGVPLMFNGTAKVSSSNHGLLTEQTSPMLVANELDFYGTSYNLISTKRFFIPDNLPAGVTDSIYFSVGGTITDITAFLLLNHTWVSDMRVTLIGPTGISVMLTPSSGTGAGAGIMTIFTSSADSTINYNNIDISPFSPKIKPANPFTPFIGTQRQGWWKLKFVDVVAGDFGFVNGWGVKLMSLTGTGNETSVPYKFDLAQNYPNPFNPVTNIKYQIAKDVNVSIKLYDMLGREIQTLVNEFKNPGFYEINFDGTKLSSGIYFYKITAGDFTDVKKMTLLK